MITSTVSAPVTLDVYLKQGSYVGSEFAPSAWTQVGVASGTSNAVANQPSNAVLARPMYIPPGQYGVALRYTGISPGDITGANSFGNGDLSLTLGAPGCPLRVSVDATDTVVGAGGTATWNFAVPNALPLSGVKLCSQAAVLDASNAFGFVTSKAYGRILGS
ncbi:MAG: hypothetical protein ACK58X_08680 [Planctomycetota bacterium]